MVLSHPDSDMIIRGHRIQPHTAHAARLGQAIKVFKVANTHVGIALSQRFVKRSIAGRVELTVLTIWTVQSKNTVIAQCCTDEREHFLDGCKTHDVGRVRGKDSIIVIIRNAVSQYVESDRLTNICKRGIAKPRMNAGVILLDIAGLPRQVPEFSSKSYGVLSGTRADLENRFQIPKFLTKDT